MPGITLGNNIINKTSENLKIFNILSGLFDHYPSQAWQSTSRNTPGYTRNPSKTLVTITHGSYKLFETGSGLQFRVNFKPDGTRSGEVLDHYFINHTITLRLQRTKNSYLLEYSYSSILNKALSNLNY